MPKIQGEIYSEIMFFKPRPSLKNEKHIIYPSAYYIAIFFLMVVNGSDLLFFFVM